MSEQTFFLEHVPTPIGTFPLVTDDAGRVRALDFGDGAPAEADARLARVLRLQYRGVITKLAARASPSPARLALEAYFAGDVGALEQIEVAFGGTDFQRSVWDALRTIPAGETLSYATLAARVGRPTAVRAVGLANGANPIAVIVPCHRVIGSNATLTGYGGGLARKRWLLEHEGVAVGG
jgi:methylated-DNA-[protein]-cysteine S-methyltransferase